MNWEQDIWFIVGLMVGNLITNTFMYNKWYGLLSAVLIVPIYFGVTYLASLFGFPV